MITFKDHNFADLHLQECFLHHLHHLERDVVWVEYHLDWPRLEQDCFETIEVFSQSKQYLVGRNFQQSEGDHLPVNSY